MEEFIRRLEKRIERNEKRLAEKLNEGDINYLYKCKRLSYLRGKNAAYQDVIDELEFYDEPIDDVKPIEVDSEFDFVKEIERVVKNSGYYE